MDKFATLAGPGGFMDHREMYQTWMDGPCQTVRVRPTSAEAFESIKQHVPCLSGPTIQDVGTALKGRCEDEIADGYFWWTDADLLNKDIAALRDAPPR